jgi:hypothetical protein
MSRTIKKQPKKERPRSIKPEGNKKSSYFRKTAYDYSDNDYETTNLD